MNGGNGGNVMQNRFLMLLSSVAVGIVLAFGALSLLGSEASAKPTSVLKVGIGNFDPPTSVELAKLWVSYQTEKLNKAPVIGSAKTRVSQVQKLVADDKLRSATDYYCAAVLLTEGATADESLLAHDLAISALAMGDTRAKTVVAYSEDQFMTRISRPQRYGTQTAKQNGKPMLKPVGPGVTDLMRRNLGLPSSRAAKKLAEDGKDMASILTAPLKVVKLSPVPSAAATLTE